MIGGMRIAHNNAVIKTAPGIEKLREECKFQQKIWPVLQSTGGRSCLAKFWWNSDHHHATLIWFPTSWKNGKVHGQMMFKTFIFLKVHLHSTAYFIIEKDYREPPFRAKSPFFAWNWELLEFVISWKLTKLLPVLSTHLHSEFSVNLQIGGIWIRHLKKISRFSVSHFYQTQVGLPYMKLNHSILFTTLKIYKVDFDVDVDAAILGTEVLPTFRS